MDKHLGACFLVAMTASCLAGGAGPPQLTSRLQTTDYELQGDRNGQVILKRRATGATRASFALPGGAVRELVLLDAGRTLAASASDQTTFWDLASGAIRERFDARAYGFSHDGTRFFTHSDDDGVLLIDYPGFTTLCQLVKGQVAGPESFLFSPDDRFLAIVFASGRPASDEHYPGPDPVYRATRLARLFDLESCLEVAQFSRLRVTTQGYFSPDSRYYELPGAAVHRDGAYVAGNWRFDLSTREVIRTSD